MSNKKEYANQPGATTEITLLRLVDLFCYSVWYQLWFQRFCLSFI